MTYKEFKSRMQKEASQDKQAAFSVGLGLLVTGLLGNIGGAIAAGAQGATNAALLHLGLNSALGIGGGALLAKATSKGQQDVADIKREFEAERLKTDIGDIQTKINQEARARKRRMGQPVQSMRLT